HLVLNRGAVARPDAFDDAGIHRRLVEGIANDFVAALIGVRDVTADLARVFLHATQIGHDRHWRITGLFLHHREIHTARIDARWRAGFQASDAQRQFTQPL